MRKTMVSLRLSERQLEQVKKQAHLEHRSMTNMIEYMIDYYIIKHEATNEQQENAHS